jgi:hypothetical protein
MAEDPVVIVDGCGDEYEVLSYAAVFTVAPANRANSPMRLSSATLRGLGWDWNGRCLVRLEDA